MNTDNYFSNGFHDARWHKSRTALSAAILELATEKPLPKITASEVAERAGVNRSTFYKHAKNPVALLRETLREDLEDLRTKMLREITPETSRLSIRRASYDVLAHVVEHKDIYRRALGKSDDAGLHQLLSDHIEGTFTIVFARGYVTLPFVDDSAATGARFTARYIAHGTVGAIDAWLADSDTLNIPEFLARFVYQMPAWWPEISAG